MKIIGVVLAGFYAMVATASSSATAEAASPGPAEGTTLAINCAESTTGTSSVSQPNTTVTVTCGENSTVEPSTPNDAANDIFLDATCTQKGVLSSVCPGATVDAAPAARDKGSKVAKADVFFPQLPASQQVLCLKCNNNNRSKVCKAVITVAAALPQGPQACAALGSSVTLRINEAGGSAQFACGNDLTLMPSGATKAYADDCQKEETLKDMTRTPGEGNYVILKAEKLKQKTLCYLCEQSEAAAKTGRKEDRCTVYVEVSGSTRSSSGVGIGVALPCVAAMLRLI